MTPFAGRRQITEWYTYNASVLSLLDVSENLCAYTTQEHAERFRVIFELMTKEDVNMYCHNSEVTLAAGIVYAYLYFLIKTDKRWEMWVIALGY